MKLSFIKSCIQRIIKKISQVKTGLHIKLRIKKHKKQTSLPFLHCNGSKTSIDISLAFRDNVKTGDSKDDLYLKGVDTNTGREINLYVIGTTAKIEGAEEKGKKLWYLQIFKTEKVFVVQQIRRTGILEIIDSFICENHGLSIKKPTSARRGDWERPVSSIVFEDLTGGGPQGRREFEIKTEKTNNFKNKDFSAGKEKMKTMTKALYLKGWDRNSGMYVDLYEKIVEDHHQVSSMRTEGEGLWVLKVFKRNGTTRLFRVNNYSNSNVENENINYESNVLSVTKKSYRAKGNWKGSADRIQFFLINSNGTLGKEICGIKIA